MGHGLLCYAFACQIFIEWKWLAINNDKFDALNHTLAVFISPLLALMTDSYPLLLLHFDHRTFSRSQERRRGEKTADKNVTELVRHVLRLANATTSTSIQYSEAQLTTNFPFSARPFQSHTHWPMVTVTGNMSTTKNKSTQFFNTLTLTRTTRARHTICPFRSHQACVFAKIRTSNNCRLVCARERNSVRDCRVCAHTHNRNVSHRLCSHLYRTRMHL